MATELVNEYCMICKREITEDLVSCPQCGAVYHYPHLAEAIKVTGKCPKCKNHIAISTEDEWIDNVSQLQKDNLQNSLSLAKKRSLVKWTEAARESKKEEKVFRSIEEVRKYYGWEDLPNESKFYMNKLIKKFKMTREKVVSEYNDQFNEGFFDDVNIDNKQRHRWTTRLLYAKYNTVGNEDLVDRETIPLQSKVFVERDGRFGEVYRSQLADMPDARVLGYSAEMVKKEITSDFLQKKFGHYGFSTDMIRDLRKDIVNEYQMKVGSTKKLTAIDWHHINTLLENELQNISDTAKGVTTNEETESFAERSLDVWKNIKSEKSASRYFWVYFLCLFILLTVTFGMGLLVPLVNDLIRFFLGG